MAAALSTRPKYVRIKFLPRLSLFLQRPLQAPKRGCGGKKRDELAPPHSITSSAVASTDWRNCQTQRFSGSDVESELGFLGLLDR
jgi:hypothetical protein